VNTQPIIDLDDVFVLYPGAWRDVAALRGLSLTVHTGERIVIHGPSGAGKSTFVKLVTAALAPNAGTALLFGRELSALDHQARTQLRSAEIGTITQHSGDDLAAELTCFENVALQPRLRGWSRSRSAAAAYQALQAVGLDAFANRRLKGMSHGELQRVGIAAALAHRPSLIVADEPTGQLDVAHADGVFDLLVSLAESHGTTLILATHDETAARLADRVLTIADGRLSSERRHGESEASAVVDRRGWLRLPATEAAGLGSRVIVQATPTGVALTASTEASATEPEVSAVAVALVPGGIVSAAADASFTVDGEVILRPTSIEVRSGQIHVIVGRSGSGKTTLLSLLTGWVAPSGGSVTVGPEVSVAICPAVPAFAEGFTVTETLGLTSRIRGREPDHAVVAGLLADLGLSDLATRSVNELSGGERQRLAIGRCLASNSHLMVFDEPTAQLDRLTAQRVIDLLGRFATEGHAIVCATHDSLLCKAAGVITELSGE
jgi:ABC-type lipoprotein export system ATPase subunit